MSWNTFAVLVVGIAGLAGCGGNPGYRQTVQGTFVRVGGPAPGSPFPLPGTITARAVTGETFTATAGRDGRFKLSLPRGTSRVTGRSPLMQSGLHGSRVSLRVHHTGDVIAGAVLGASGAIAAAALL